MQMMGDTSVRWTFHSCFFDTIYRVVCCNAEMKAPAFLPFQPMGFDD